MYEILNHDCDSWPIKVRFWVQGKRIKTAL